MQAFLDADVPGGANGRGLGGRGGGSSASDGVLAALRLDPAERSGGGGEGGGGAAAPASSWGLRGGGAVAIGGGVVNRGGSPLGVTAMAATAAAALDALLPFLSTSDAVALISALDGEGEATRLSRIFRAAMATRPGVMPDSSGSSSGGSGGACGVTASIAPSATVGSPPTGRLSVVPGGGRSAAALGRNWGRLASLTASAGVPNGTSFGGAAPKRRRPPQPPTHNSQEVLALAAAAAAPPPPSSSTATVSYSMPDMEGSAGPRLWAAPGSSNWDGSRASWPTLSDSVSCAGDGGAHGLPPAFHALSVSARSPVGTSPASSEETAEGVVTSSWAAPGAPAATSSAPWATEVAGRSAHSMSWSYEEGGDTLSLPVGRSGPAPVLDKRARAAGRAGGGGREDETFSSPATVALSLPSSLSWAGGDAVARAGPRTSWAMSSWVEEPSQEVPTTSSSTMAAVVASASDFLTTTSVSASASASAAAEVATSLSSTPLVVNDDRPGPWERDGGGRITTNGAVGVTFGDAGWQQPWRSFAGSSAGADW